MTVYRMDHAGLVVEDLEAAVSFFVELGLEIVGRASIDGGWADELLALDDVRATIVMVRTPDGHSQIELSTFQNPTAVNPAPDPPANIPGIPRLTFVLDSIDDVTERLKPHGAELVGAMTQYEDVCRYCYVRGPAGVIIGLVEELG